MEKSKTRTIQSLLLTLALMVAALGVSPAAVAAEKKMVKDPSTGEMVEAPRYGGTFTYGYSGPTEAHVDAWWGHLFPLMLGPGVLERPTIANWAIDRNEWAINGADTPTQF